VIIEVFVKTMIEFMSSIKTFNILLMIIALPVVKFQVVIVVDKDKVFLGSKFSIFLSHSFYITDICLCINVLYNIVFCAVLTVDGFSLMISNCLSKF
jgi:hypothetical protein